jgi:hypothetical protein
MREVSSEAMMVREDGFEACPGSKMMRAKVDMGGKEAK